MKFSLSKGLFYSWKTNTCFHVVNSCGKRNASSFCCFFIIRSVTFYKNGFFFGLLLKQFSVNPLNAEFNPICHLLELLGAHYFLHVGRVRVKIRRSFQKFCTLRLRGR